MMENEGRLAVTYPTVLICLSSSSRVGPCRRGASRDEGAAAYTIWNRWIASRGFDPAPVVRGEGGCRQVRA